MVAWGISLLGNAPKYNRSAYGVVEGRQCNNRAELMAILALLRAIPFGSECPNVLCAVDSQIAFDKIKKFASLSPNEKRKMVDRDLVKEILHLLEQHKSAKQREFRFIRFPSHMDDPDAAARKDDAAKAVKAQVGALAYEHLLKANVAADQAAGLVVGELERAAEEANQPAQRGNRDQNPHLNHDADVNVLRNYHTKPTPFLDDFYVTDCDAKSAIVDGPIFPFIKGKWSALAHRRQLGQQATDTGRIKSGARVQEYRLATSDLVDPVLSFKPITARHDASYHRAHRVIFAGLNHAYGTGQKLNSVANQSTHRNPAMQQFVKHMYPTPDCLACANAGVGSVVENTHHLFSCPSRQSRKDASAGLREKVRQRITKAANGQLSESLDALPNLAFPTAAQTAESKRLASNLPPNSAVRKFVESYDERLASRGLIPKTLIPLLLKLGAKPKKAKKAASKIAVDVQKAILAELRLRRKEIERARNAPQLYRRFALGLHDDGAQNAGNGHDPPAA